MRFSLLTIVPALLFCALSLPRFAAAADSSLILPDMEDVGTSLARLIHMPRLVPSENVLATSTRTGSTVIEPVIPPGQTKLFVSIFADPALLREPRALSVKVEQVPPDAPPWLFGAMEVADVKKALTTLDREGHTPSSLTLSLGELVLREDATDPAWNKRREITTINDSYYQMAIQKPRVTIRVFDPRTGQDADLAYSVLVYTEDEKPAGLPSGHHSASLIGSFAGGGASAATTVTSGSRTSTAGSFVVGMGASWDTNGTQDNTISDTLTGCANPCNSYTEQVDYRFSTEVMITMATNNAGTRGAGHTITNTTSDVGSVTAAGAEFSGIALSPTVATSTATGDPAATSPSVAVSSTASSLFVGMASYDGIANLGTTLTEDTVGGWALAVEVDESDNFQDFNSEYKGGISGSQTASWTLGGGSFQQAWGAAIMAVTEMAAPTYPVKIRGKVKIRGGGSSTSNTTVTFNTSGNQSWPVPAGVASITVKSWGAGGGGGAKVGGGGGFAQATVVVTPLESLTVYVGGKGLSGASGVGGSGGGYSAVSRGTIPAGTTLVQAGGGAGGGGSGVGEGGAGGAGGGTSGVTGTNSLGGATGGGGAGGAGGTAGSARGTAGTANQGGAGGDGTAGSGTGSAGGTNGGGASGAAGGTAGGGGGGGGRFGGGGGGAGSGGGGGGGGGSDLVTGSGTVETAGSGTTPGNNTDTTYTGSVGVGGAIATNGNDGYVAITYASATTQTPQVKFR